MATRRSFASTKARGPDVPLALEGLHLGLPQAGGSWGPKEADGCCRSGTPGTIRLAELSATTGWLSSQFRPEIRARPMMSRWISLVPS
jgi:hypothetical protein